MIATNFRYSVARVTIVTPPRTIKEEEEEDDESGTIVPSSRSGRHKYVSCLQSITPGNEAGSYYIIIILWCLTNSKNEIIMDHIT